MQMRTSPATPEETALADILNTGHRKYPPEHYAVVRDEFLTGEPGDAGVFRVFSYKDSLRFAILFDGPSGGESVAHIAESVRSQLAAADQKKALLWYSQRSGLDSGLINALSVSGEPFYFLEMTMDRRRIGDDVDPGELHVRAFLDGDDEACIELLERAYTPVLDPPGTFRQDREWLMGLFRNAHRSRTELFFTGGELAGMYCHSDGDMEFICVDPRHQGKGYGEIILRWALQAIKADTGNKPRLTVAAINARAISLYWKAGFETVCRSVRVTVVSPEP